MRFNKFKVALVLLITISFSQHSAARFLQTDPIGYKDDMDLYTYVGNDPINHTDPTGLSCDRNPSNPSVVSNCQIDKVPEKMSKKEQDAVNAYNKQYTTKVQGLFKNPNKQTTVTLADGSKVKTTNGAVGRALEGRNVVYDPKKAGDGASTKGDTTTLSTAAVTGYRADGSALTAPGISVTGPALTGIILEHEGLHNTIDRNTPDSNNPSHQEEYNRAAKEIDDSIK